VNTPIDTGVAVAKRNWLRTAFPVPRSLHLSEVAVYISDGTLRFFEFSRARGRVHPKNFGTLPFPRFHLNAINEKTREEVVLTLKKWAMEHKYKRVRAVIHEDEAYVFKVTVPTASERELREAIEGVLEENVPIPPSDAVFEYEIMAVDRKSGETTVAVSVLNQTSVLEATEIFEASGLEVVSIDTEARTLARVLFPPHDTGVHAVLSVAEHHSILSIVENGAVVFSSSLKVGAADIDKEIAKAFGITEEAARAMKLEKAYTEIDGDMKLFEAMLPIFSLIRDEIGKVLVYWKGQSKKDPYFRDVSDIVLVGSNSFISGFDRYIAITTKIPARVGSVWTNILSINDTVPKLPRRESLDYGVVIGALL
jgi:Tfp pilus assembly PilM family ATPase